MEAPQRHRRVAPMGQQHHSPNRRTRTLQKRLWQIGVCSISCEKSGGCGCDFFGVSGRILKSWGCFSAIGSLNAFAPSATLCDQFCFHVLIRTWYCPQLSVSPTMERNRPRETRGTEAPPGTETFKLPPRHRPQRNPCRPYGWQRYPSRRNSARTHKATSGK